MDGHDVPANDSRPQLDLLVSDPECSLPIQVYGLQNGEGGGGGGRGQREAETQKQTQTQTHTNTRVFVHFCNFSSHLLALKS